MKAGVNAYVGANTKDFTTKMQRLQGTMKSTFAAFKPYAMAIGAATVAIGTAAIKAAADMEVLKNRLVTAFQGNQTAAQAALGTINKFTAQTPFQLEQVASAFIKLKNLGLDPSMESLKSYGNTASAMGKSLDQMVEAVADATVGEFERLKEFGIKAKSEGDNVSFTFRGITTTVKKSSEEIQGYLLNIGNTDFAGAMETQSKTLYGQLSTLKDQVIILASALGEVLLPAVKRLASAFSTLASKIQNAVNQAKFFRDSESSMDKLLKERERLQGRVYAQARGTERRLAYQKELDVVNKLIDAEKTLIFGRNQNLSQGRGISGAFAAMRQPSATPTATTPGLRRRGGLIGEIESVAMSASIFGDRIAAGLSEVPEKLNQVKDGFISVGKVIDENLMQQIEQMNMMLESFVENTIGSFADALGAAFAGGGFENFGDAILANLSDFLGQFGKMLIAYGFSITAFYKAITNPAVAIAAGATLVAIAGGIRQHLSNSNQALTNGGSSSGGTQRIEINGVVRAGDLVYVTDRYNSRRK